MPQPLSPLAKPTNKPAYAAQPMRKLAMLGRIEPDAPSFRYLR
jgi:hypothetical protein